MLSVPGLTRALVDGIERLFAGHFFLPRDRDESRVVAAAREHLTRLEPYGYDQPARAAEFLTVALGPGDFHHPAFWQKRPHPSYARARNREQARISAELGRVKDKHLDENCRAIASQMPDLVVPDERAPYAIEKEWKRRTAFVLADYLRALAVRDGLEHPPSAEPVARIYELGFIVDSVGEPLRTGGSPELSGRARIGNNRLAVPSRGRSSEHPAALPCKPVAGLQTP